MILISKHSASIYFKTFKFFFLKLGSTHDGTAYCPGESCWQNQTVLKAELLGELESMIIQLADSLVMEMIEQLEVKTGVSNCPRI